MPLSQAFLSSLADKAMERSIDRKISPYFPSSDKVIEDMFSLAGVGEGDVLYDVGSGDGRVLIRACHYGVQTAVGVEIEPTLVKESLKLIAEDAVSRDKATVKQGDFSSIDFSPATVIIIYMGPAGTQDVQKYVSDLHPSVRIVSHDYAFVNWKPLRSIKGTHIQPCTEGATDSNKSDRTNFPPGEIVFLLCLFDSVVLMSPFILAFSFMSDDLPLCWSSSDEETDSFLYLIFIGLLVLGYMFALMTKQFKQLHFLHESSLFIMIGGVGGFIAYLTPSQRLQVSAASFDSEIFFLILLPPIIFESGYNMNKRIFFSNFFSIFMYAIMGTLISTTIVGVGLYSLSYYAPKLFPYQLGFMECISFGAVISATDPVTVLAIFKELKVDPTLYSLVFGESVLNDAIAVVLYTTTIAFVDVPLDRSSVILGIVQFLVVSVGSVLLGCAIGVLTAIFYKFVKVENPSLEFSLLLLFSYSSYLFAEGLKLSGIVSVLFCGITMAHYARKNITKETKKFSVHFFEILANLAESTVFLYLGLSIFLSWVDHNFVLIIGTIVLCLIGRAFNVFPISAFLNLRKGKRIPKTHQLMLWFSGLRGAMAFALAMDLRTRTVNGPIFLTATIVIILLTVFFLGSCTSTMLDLLKIQKGTEISEEESPHTLSWWEKYDNHYIKPFLRDNSAPSNSLTVVANS